jgi:hypothetical protein
VNNAVVQIAGQASVLEMDYVRSTVERSSAFRATLMRYEQMVLVQAHAAGTLQQAGTIR